MRFVVVLLLAAFVAAGLPGAGQEPTRQELLNAFEKQLKAVAATAGPSIATVVVSRSEHYPKAPGAADTPGKLGGFDPTEFLKTDPTDERARLAKSLDLADPKTIPVHGYAGGVVIDPAGLVLTPYHVIDGATRVYVYLPGGAGSYADVLAADARSDLAVLKLIKPPPGLKAIKFGDVRITERGGQKANVDVGKLVVLMANPYSTDFGIDRPTAVPGSITNVRYRASPAPGKTTTSARSVHQYAPLLDAKPIAGITGGVLLNLDGEMIGLTTAAGFLPGEEPGPGYALVADDHLIRILGVLRRGEEVEYGFLGVMWDGEPDWERREDRRGIGVQSVTPQSPAALAGIQPGDVIVRINDTPVSGFNDLLYHIGHALAGSKVTVAVFRRGRVQDFEVTVAKFRHDQPFIASVRPQPVFGLRVDHGSVLAQQLSRHPRVEASGVEPGVGVREVLPDSPAATQFKALGDSPTRWLITHVDGAAVATPAEFYKAARGRQSVKLTLIDPTELNRRPRELTLP